MNNTEPIAELTKIVIERFDQVEKHLTTQDSAITDMRTEMRSLRDNVDQLQERLADLSGYSKEIDALADRISLIENHLGLNQQIRT